MSCFCCMPCQPLRLGLALPATTPCQSLRQHSQGRQGTAPAFPVLGKGKGRPQPFLRSEAQERQGTAPAFPVLWNVLGKGTGRPQPFPRFDQMGPHRPPCAFRWAQISMIHLLPYPDRGSAKWRGFTSKKGGKCSPNLQKLAKIEVLWGPGEVLGPTGARRGPPRGPMETFLMPNGGETTNN